MSHSVIRIPPDNIHYRWDNSLKPAAKVKPGETIAIEIVGGEHYGVSKHSTANDLKKMERDKIHPLTGPVYVEGAEPGDALVVDILELKPGDWGYTSFTKGRGLLGHEAAPFFEALQIDDDYLQVWEIRNRYATFGKGIRVPVEPFLGVMGTAPRQAGTYRTFSPREFGGNMDIKHFRRGTKLFLPVFVQGALFSAGDGHAAQGDGEVCVTAIETSMTARLKLSLKKNANLPEPVAIVGPIASAVDRKGYYVTTALSEDLLEGAKKSIRYMIDYLVKERGLTMQEAYVICSVVVDLKISQVVDQPNWIVSAYLPLGIFT